MVTAELAACLPVLMLLLAVALSAVQVADMRIRVEDAAREAARLAARGDDAGAGAVARDGPAGLRVSVSRTGDEVVAVATAPARLLGTGVAPVSVRAEAVAAAEPGVASAAP